jgi:hypothetical protein
VDIRLASVHDSATTTCAKNIYHLHQSAPNVPAADVFGNGIFHLVP